MSNVYFYICTKHKYNYFYVNMRLNDAYIFAIDYASQILATGATLIVMQRFTQTVSEFKLQKV